MEKVIKVSVYTLLGLAVIGGLTFYFTDGFYRSLVAEDGPFEYLTALTLLFISILFAIRFFKERKQRNKWWALLNVLIILGAFFGFGEEISWGQRIFSIESSEFFANNNMQAETNLHNLEIGGVNINKLIFSQGLVVVFGFYFLFSQVLYRKWDKFRNLVDLFGVQLPKIKHSVAIMLCTGLILLIPDWRIWELWEAMFVLILLWVFVEPYNESEKIFHSAPSQ